jgi:hypothetical protein
LSSWVRDEDPATAVAQHNEDFPNDRVSTPQQAFQATLDRAVESWWKQCVVGDR